MKARVSKNLKGTLSLPTISSRAMSCNAEFELDLEQYWKPDVQAAILKKFVVITSGEPKCISEVEIVKTTPGSISLPIVKKVLRDDTPFRIREDILNRIEFKKLIKDKLIVVLGKASKVSKTAPEATETRVARDVAKELPSPLEAPAPAQQKGANGLVWDAGAVADHEQAEIDAKAPKPPVKKRGKKSTGATKVSENSLIIDPSKIVDDGTDGIQWVDVEQNQERLKKHPILGKKRNLDLNG